LERLFLPREARRVELKAISACTMLHLPLHAMQLVAAHDPAAIRCLSRITVSGQIATGRGPVI
jgi:hypothetical protein